MMRNTKEMARLKRQPEETQPTWGEGSCEKGMTLATEFSSTSPLHSGQAGARLQAAQERTSQRRKKQKNKTHGPAAGHRGTPARLSPAPGARGGAAGLWAGGRTRGSGEAAARGERAPRTTGEAPKPRAGRLGAWTPGRRTPIACTPVAWTPGRLRAGRRRPPARARARAPEGPPGAPRVEGSLDHVGAKWRPPRPMLWTPPKSGQQREGEGNEGGRQGGEEGRRRGGRGAAPAGRQPPMSLTQAGAGAFPVAFFSWWQTAGMMTAFTPGRWILTHG
ncbi:translation initiation factor IF-2-like [Camelus ferus]|uniref:Translation initiation factor IF-2-like n=1 Tax=Camelus ferus TaxID=419612 RepID=A0A8B8SA62_CAMFR|nr:translation initiation factor IF-2-like [Camelus ferus]